MRTYYVVPVATGKTAKETRYIVVPRKPVGRTAYTIRARGPKEAQRAAKKRHLAAVDRLVETVVTNSKREQFLRRALA